MSSGWGRCGVHEQLEFGGLGLQKTSGRQLSGLLRARGEDELYRIAYGVSQRTQEMMRTKGTSQTQRMQ